MIIAIGTDHGGYDLKESLLKYLKSKGYELIDCGTDSDESVDYPDYGLKVAEKIISNKAELGVLICTTGIGQSIVANKIPGIRAALCLNVDQAEHSRKHNDANVIVFGAKYTKEKEAKKIIDIWLDTAFEGGRHKIRVDKIKEIEKKYCKDIE